MTKKDINAPITPNPKKAEKQATVLARIDAVRFKQAVCLVSDFIAETPHATEERVKAFAEQIIDIALMCKKISKDTTAQQADQALKKLYAKHGFVQHDTVPPTATTH